MTREILILDSCDVLVCGGNFGGISAALAAARLGKRVILLEKQYILGGLGTAGLITYYLPLCDGVGHQVSFGLAEELLQSVHFHGRGGRIPRQLAGQRQTRRGGRKRITASVCAITHGSLPFWPSRNW